jgi:pimeloyl-ACP methyl ester carboxylesterase
VTSDELWAALDGITRPTLLIRGRHSPLLPTATAATMVQRLRSGELVEIPRGGHDLGVEQPAAVADAVRPFLLRP